MRFLHFSTSNGPGGAGRAAYGLHSALRCAGQSSQMFVRYAGPRECRPGKTRDNGAPTNANDISGDRDVQAVPANVLVAQLRRLQKHLPFVHPARARFTFNNDLDTGVRWRRAVEAIARPVDAICLHWVAGFLTARSIRAIFEHFGCPLLWTVMDQEPVTGGCHYSFGCDGYRRQCGRCPLLERPSEFDTSRRVFLRKQRYLGDLPITFVAPTSWVEDRVRQSALFGQHRVERIPLAIDTNVFCTGDQASAREALGIPLNKQVIFSGSSYLHEPRKGAAYLIEALRRVHCALSRPCQRTLPNDGSSRIDRPPTSRADELLLLMAGHNGDDLKRRLPFPVVDLGYLSDEGKLATAYRAADVFVCPSIEDAGPMMIPEAMLCGTPVVAFHAGGAPDLVISGRTGYLARLSDADDLASGMLKVLASPDRAALGQQATQAALKLHEPRSVATQYAALVEELNGLRAAEQRGAAA